MIEIWEPRWKDRQVLISKFKVRDGVNYIKFTKAKCFLGKVFKIEGKEIRKCPLGTNGKISCYEVPLDLLEEVK